MDHLCGSTCAKKHTKCWRKHTHKNGYKHILDRWNNDKHRKSLSDIGWTEEVLFNTKKSHWKTIPTLQQEKEVGTRNHGNSHWMKVYKDHWSSAVTLNRRSRHAKYWTKSTQQSLEVETNLSSATSPTKARWTVWRLWRTCISTWCFYRMAILSFFHNAFVFIFAITMAT